jgi:hypothetical protein
MGEAAESGSTDTQGVLEWFPFSFPSVTLDECSSVKFTR